MPNYISLNEEKAHTKNKARRTKKIVNGFKFLWTDKYWNDIFIFKYKVIRIQNKAIFKKGIDNGLKKILDFASASQTVRVFVETAFATQEFGNSFSSYKRV